MRPGSGRPYVPMDQMRIHGDSHVLPGEDNRIDSNIAHEHEEDRPAEQRPLSKRRRVGGVIVHRRVKLSARGGNAGWVIWVLVALASRHHLPPSQAISLDSFPHAHQATMQSRLERLPPPRLTCGLPPLSSLKFRADGAKRHEDGVAAGRRDDCDFLYFQAVGAVGGGSVLGGRGARREWRVDGKGCHALSGGGRKIMSRALRLRGGMDAVQQREFEVILEHLQQPDATPQQRQHAQAYIYTDIHAYIYRYA
jgi:hypothetical protein